MANINPRLGAFKDKVDPRDFLVRRIMQEVPLPPRVSYQERYPAVRDQGFRGSCVAHATCAVKEYQELKQRKFKKPFDLSEEWVYDQVMMPGGGAYPREAFKLLIDKGVPREKFMPYKPESYQIGNTLDNEVPTFSPSPAAKRNAGFYKAQGFARLTTVSDMQQSLLVNGPFMIGVDWLDNWFKPQGRVIEDYPVLDPGQGGVSGGHAICVVGYLTVEGRVYFIFRNSWGKDWANGGYALFSRETIEQNLMDAWTVFDSSNPLIVKSEVKKLIVEKAQGQGLDKSAPTVS